jgi:RNA-binding protein
MALTNDKKKELKSQSKSLKPFISIGKNGISETTIQQIIIHLKANRLGKCKILRTFLEEQGLDKKDVANDLAQKTTSQIIDMVGFTVTFYK